MYLLQPSASRTSAPRRVYRLCRVPTTFSAISRAFCRGSQMFISAGDSVPGVFWKVNGTPSSTRSSPSPSIRRVGASRLSGPRANPLPMAMSTCPCGPLGSCVPYW